MGATGVQAVRQDMPQKSGRTGPSGSAGKKRPSVAEEHKPKGSGPQQPLVDIQPNFGKMGNVVETGPKPILLSAGSQTDTHAMQVRVSPEQLQAVKEKYPHLSHAAQLAIANSRDPNLTDEERLRRTNTQALALFRTNKKDYAALAQVMRNMGVEIYRADEHPWVDEVLKRNNMGAALVVPNSIKYPGAPIGKHRPSLMPEEFTSLVNQAEREGKFFIVMPREENTFPAMVYEEIYHAIQAMNGLPLALDDPTSNKIANDFKSNFLRDYQARPLDPTFQKWLPAETKRLQEKRAKGQLPTIPNGPGEALRQQTNRELEAHRFLLTYADQLGLTQQERAHLTYNKNAQQALKGVSYRLDETW